MLKRTGQRWMLNRPLPTKRTGNAEAPRFIRIPKPCNDNGRLHQSALVLKITFTFGIVVLLLGLALWRGHVFF